MQSSHFHRLLIFTTASALFVLSQFYRAAIAVITPELTADLGINTREMSLISAAFFYAFALTQVPLAVYLDRIGARRTMLILNLIAVAGALVFATAQSPGALILARMLLGVGMACNLMGTFKLISQLYTPAMFATLTTVVFSMGTAGSLVATTPLVLLVHAVGWRYAFVLFAGTNLLLTGIFFMAAAPTSSSLPHPPSAGSKPAGLKGALTVIATLFHIREYWIISAGTFCRYGVYAAIQTLYAGPYLMNVMGLTPVQTGNLLLGMNIGFICGGPMFGMLSDKWLHTRKWVIIPGLCGTALLLSVLSRLQPGAGILWMVLIFIALGVFNSTAGIMYTHIKEHVPMDKSGTAMTGINFFTMIGPAIFLQVSGMFMQHFYTGNAWSLSAFKSLLMIYSVCLAGVALLYLLTRENRIN